MISGNSKMSRADMYGLAPLQVHNSLCTFMVRNIMVKSLIGHKYCIRHLKRFFKGSSATNEPNLNLCNSIHELLGVQLNVCTYYRMDDIHNDICDRLSKNLTCSHKHVY